MDASIKNCSVEELEERALCEDAEAAAELARRYRTGTDGVPRDGAQAARWQTLAQQLDPNLTEPLPEEDTGAADAAPASPAYDLTPDEMFAGWYNAYRQGAYDHVLSRELQKAEKEGNPYAACVLARRCRDSESEADRSQTRPLLERARALLEQRVASTADADACRMLVEVLTELGHAYAGEDAGEEDLQKALNCFTDARELDDSASEGLLWFYSGPAQRMAAFAQDPDKLEKLRFALARHVVEGKGIGPQLAFALHCREENRLVEARDWLQTALQAPDAAAHPDLCAVARYYQAVLSGGTPDLQALQAAAPSSAWACLLLGEQAAAEEDQLAWYARGAALEGDPKAEDCRRAQQKILTEREEQRRRAEEQARIARAAAEAAAARKAAEEAEAARRKETEEREAAERKAAEERLRQEQNARYARWSETARSGVYETSLSSDLQKAEEDGNPYATYVLGQRYLQSSGAADRAKALPALSHCRKLLTERCKTADDPDARALLVGVLTLLGRLYAARGDDPSLEKAEACLTEAYKMDDATLETLLSFYDQYGAKLPAFRKDRAALEARRAPLAEKSARQGGIVRRLRFALYCQEQGASVKAGDWLRLALTAPDAADHPAVCSVARYYQDLYDGREPDLSELQDAASHSSWACLVLGDRSTDEAEQLAFYRQGAALSPAEEGEESMAALCRSRCEAIQQRAEQARQAAQARQEALRREAEARQAEQAKAAAAAREKEEREARLSWWETAWQAGDYTNALSNALQSGLEEGNPFAAFVLSQRYLSSGSDRDRQEAITVLQQARRLAEGYLDEQERPVLHDLLLEVLRLLGRTWAAGDRQDSLKNAHEALLAAVRLDPAARADLLWFYRGPAKALEQFARHPDQLEKLCLTLQEQDAREGGIFPRLRLALYCRENKRNVSAKDWLNLALNAADADTNPSLLAVARFYQAQWNGQKADLTDLRKAADAGSSWACLLLGDLAREEDNQLKFYLQGAQIDPATENGASRAADCAQRRDAIYRRRAAARNEALQRQKQAEEAAARQAEDARLEKAQNSWLSVFGVAYFVTLAAYVVLSLLAGASGSGFYLMIAGLLAHAWTLGAALVLAATFGGYCPAVYRGHLTKLRLTLVLVIALTLLVPMALDTLL